MVGDRPLGLVSGDTMVGDRPLWPVSGDTTVGGPPAMASEWGYDGRGTARYGE